MFCYRFFPIFLGNGDKNAQKYHENFPVDTLFENFYVGTKTFLLICFSKTQQLFPLAGPPGVWTLPEGQWGAGGGGGGDESEGGEGG